MISNEYLLEPIDLQRKADNVCGSYALYSRLALLRAFTSRYFNKQITMESMFEQSIAEHTTNMANLVGSVYMEFNDLFAQKALSIDKMRLLCLNHDLAEAVTGDAATNVDGVTAELKNALEAGALDRIGGETNYGWALKSEVGHYETKEEYPTKIVKMIDALELVLFNCMCNRNGLGLIEKDDNDGYKVSDCEGVYHHIDDTNTYTQIEPYFSGERELAGRLSTARIMYDSSLEILEKRFGRHSPELVGIFNLVCTSAFSYPFEEHNIINDPPYFAGRKAVGEMVAVGS